MRFAAAVATIAALLNACGGSESADQPLTPLPSGTIQIVHEGGVLYAELAVTPEQRAAGLSNRASLAVDAGMLFVYNTPGRPSFWMRQTRIPLDLVWIGADKRVSQITAGVQPEPGVADASLRRYRPDADVLYVLELNAGASIARGIAPGDQLEFATP
jgi:uncharacterized membrane protein (UPF0127 family)